LTGWKFEANIYRSKPNISKKKKKKKESNMPEKNGKVKLAVRDYTIKYKYESGTCKQIRMKE
jgi:hypothetical protein